MAVSTTKTPTQHATQLLRAYGLYLVDHAENIIGDIDKPNYVTEDGIKISFTLLYDKVPTLKVEKEYLVLDGMEIIS